MPDLMSLAANGLVLMEPLVTAAAGMILFHARGRTLAESAASSLITTIMIFSLVCQANAAGQPWSSAGDVALILLTGAAGWTVWRNRHQPGRMVQDASGFLEKRNTGVVAFLVLCQGVLLFRAITFLPQVRHLGILASVGSAGKLSGFFPTNTQILARPFMRPGMTWWGCGLLGYAGYSSLVLSTYALARRYAWMPVAFTVAVIVAGFPRFVYHAAGPGFEIIPASMALFAILLTYRLKESPDSLDLGLLVLVLGYLSSHGPMDLIASSILGALCLVLLIRRHGFFLARRIRKLWICCGVVLIPLVVFTRPWAYVEGSIFQGFETNPDEMIGGAANAVRYFFQSLDTSALLDEFVRYLAGTGFRDILQGIYLRFADPLFGSLGAPSGFSMDQGDGAVFSWFGPLGALLVMPAVLHAMVKGPRRLRFVGVALVSYIYLVCLAGAWHPENVRYFSVVFACGGFFMAFSLPPWRLGRKGNFGIQVIALIIMAYTAIHL